MVTLSSTAHKFGRMNFDDLQGKRRYFRWSAYGQSKLSNLLFAFELQRRADEAGLELTSVAAHPGYAATNLQTRADEAGGLLTRVEDVMMAVSNRLVAQSDEMGTLPQLYAATVPDLAGWQLRGARRLSGAAWPPPGLLAPRRRRGTPMRRDGFGRSRRS